MYIHRHLPRIDRDASLETKRHPRMSAFVRLLPVAFMDFMPMTPNEKKTHELLLSHRHTP